MNIIVVGDTEYEATEAYVRGVYAFRGGLNYRDDSPYFDLSDKHDDWQAGYSNEEYLQSGSIDPNDHAAWQVHNEFKRPQEEFGTTDLIDQLVNRIDEIEHTVINRTSSTDVGTRVSATNALWKLHMALQVLRGAIPKGWTYEQ